MKPQLLPVVALAGIILSSQSSIADTATPAVHRLKQGWSAKQSDWFYSTTQGSQILPYVFYTALEKSDSRQLFNSTANLEAFRCIPRPPTSDNPDGLPVGFVPDPGSQLPANLNIDKRSLGFTCAACHTAQVTYKGAAIRIDGGPTTADMDGLLIAMTGALTQTYQEQDKFGRFAQRILGPNVADKSQRSLLRKALGETVAVRQKYEKTNYSSTHYGYARLDAFGRIFNNSLVAVSSANRLEPNAPVSYPFLWDTPLANSVQWTGNAHNGLLGSLSRNVGEVFGVFAYVNTQPRQGEAPPAHGYQSSASFKNLIAIENQLKSLKSPKWPGNLLPSIETAESKARIKAGKALFSKHCAECHKSVNTWARYLPFVYSFKSVLIPLDDHQTDKGWVPGLDTDRTAAALIRDSVADSGVLKGTRKLFTFNKTYAAKERVEVITEDCVVRVLKGALAGPPKQEEGRSIKLTGNGLPRTAKLDVIMPSSASAEQKAEQAEKSAGKSTADKDELKYRARPLDGIWATGPYLHNGSVPTLYDLLLPPAKRPKVFYVGNREFDPVKVGPVTTQAPGTSRFDTRAHGNSNRGHDYGASCMTEEERWQLVEYLKSL